MENKHLAVAIPVVESEKGWGRKIDDYMVCLTMEDAEAFKKEFNSKNTSDTTPDWYMKVEGEPKPIDITDAQLKSLNETKEKRSWLSELKKLEA